jgi:hypothetical protein
VQWVAAGRLALGVPVVLVQLVAAGRLALGLPVPADVADVGGVAAVEKSSAVSVRRSCDYGLAVWCDVCRGLTLDPGYTRDLGFNRIPGIPWVQGIPGAPGKPGIPGIPGVVGIPGPESRACPGSRVSGQTLHRTATS